MSTAFTKSYFLSLDLAQKLLNLNGDTFRLALTNTAPVQGTTHVLADVTQIANGNGYTTVADGAGETCGAGACASQTNGAMHSPSRRQVTFGLRPARAWRPSVTWSSWTTPPPATMCSAGGITDRP